MKTNDDEYEEYACQYEYDDKIWAVRIHARSRFEAERKLRAAGRGEVLGPIGFKVALEENAIASFLHPIFLASSVTLIGFGIDRHEWYLQAAGWLIALGAGWVAYKYKLFSKK